MMFGKILLTVTVSETCFDRLCPRLIQKGDSSPLLLASARIGHGFAPSGISSLVVVYQDFKSLIWDRNAFRL